MATKIEFVTVYSDKEGRRVEEPMNSGTATETTIAASEANTIGYVLRVRGLEE